MLCSVIGGKYINNVSGFGDVLILSEASFNAGVLLGCNINYRNLESKRSGEISFSSTGINEAMRRVLRHAAAEAPDLVVDIPYLKNQEDLQKWIDENKKIILSRGSNEDCLVEFRFVENPKMAAINLIDLSAHLVGPTGYFGAVFSTSKVFSELNAGKTLFRSCKKKILVHVRRGDIALFDFGYKVVSPWGINGNLLRPALVEDLAALTQPYYDDDLYIAIADMLKSVYGDDNCEIVVVSDGHKRGADLLALGVPQGLLTSDEISRISTMSNDLDAAMGERFRQRLGAQAYISETDPDLVAVAATAVDADVIVSLSGGFLAGALRCLQRPDKYQIFIGNDGARLMLNAGHVLNVDTIVFSQRNQAIDSLKIKVKQTIDRSNQIV